MDSTQKYIDRSASKYQGDTGMDRLFGSLNVDSKSDQSTAADLNRLTNQLLQTEAGETYTPCPKYRKMLGHVVSSVLREFGLVDYDGTDQIVENKHFTNSDIEKMVKIMYAEVYLCILHLKPFFRKHYLNMCSSEGAYAVHMFRVLRHIFNRRGGHFFANLMSGQAFVVLATAYLCHNGMWAALKHPVRILAAYFETRLRAIFYSRGGYKTLAKHCENHELLWAYQQIQLGTDRTLDSRYYGCYNRYQQACKALIASLENPNIADDEANNTSDLVLQVKAWMRHDDLILRKKRNLGSEWIFRDHLLMTSIVDSMEKEEVVVKKRDDPRLDLKKSSHRPPLVDEELIVKIQSCLFEVNSKLCMVDKMAELVLLE